jgi:molecular chaperone GrpE
MILMENKQPFPPENGGVEEVREHTNSHQTPEDIMSKIEVDGVSGTLGKEEDGDAFAKVTELEQEKQELAGRLLRLQADFDNFRKRMRQEKETLVDYANHSLFEKLLPIVDNLERAVSVSPEAGDTVLEGVVLIRRQFMEILEKEGVVPMECRGEPFDPHFHEAVLQEKSQDCPAGTVLEELRKGYMNKDKILRVSQVKVASE